VKEGGEEEGKCERERALERLRYYIPGHNSRTPSSLEIKTVFTVFTASWLDLSAVAALSRAFTGAQETWRENANHWQVGF
jgi:hypothetical protein